MKKGMRMILAILILAALPICIFETVLAQDAELDLPAAYTPWQGDPADTPVQVYKTVEGQAEIIFQGRLGDYDNGAWSGMDFSRAPAAVIFDWDTDETVYIVPAADNGSSMHAQQTDPALDVTARYFINDQEIEIQTGEIQAGDVIAAEYTLENNSTDPQPVRLMICLYTAEKDLADCNIVSDTVPAGGARTVRGTLTAEECGYVKVFLWDGFGTLTPLYTAVQIGTTPEPQENETVIFSCIAGEQYHVVTAVDSAAIRQQESYIIQYDPARLQALDLNALTDEQELEPGETQEADVVILDFDPQAGKIIFKNPNYGTEASSMLLNDILFQAIETDMHTAVTVK